jgi:hypothetical protein
MDDFIPVLPSFQTWLSLFLSPEAVDANGAQLALLLEILCFIVINLFIFAPVSGPSVPIRIALFVAADLLPLLGLLHNLSQNWNYNAEETAQIIHVIQNTSHPPASADERAYRAGIIGKINSIYSWSQTADETSSIRAGLYAQLDDYYKQRDARRAKLDADYQEGTIGWWTYRHGIDTLDAELPPGLATYISYTPRAAHLATYGVIFTVLALITLPLQRQLGSLLFSSNSSNNAVALDKKLAEELLAYNQVEIMNGAFKGPFFYKAGYLHMGDLKMIIIGGQWVSQGEETGEYLTPSRTTLRFTKRTKARNSIFGQ